MCIVGSWQNWYSVILFFVCRFRLKLILYYIFYVFINFKLCRWDLTQHWSISELSSCSKTIKLSDKHMIIWFQFFKIISLKPRNKYFYKMFLIDFGKLYDFFEKHWLNKITTFSPFHFLTFVIFYLSTWNHRTIIIIRAPVPMKFWHSHILFSLK